MILCRTRWFSCTPFAMRSSNNASKYGRNANRSVFRLKDLKESTLKKIRVSDLQASNVIFLDHKVNTFFFCSPRIAVCSTPPSPFRPHRKPAPLQTPWLETSAVVAALSIHKRRSSHGLLSFSRSFQSHRIVLSASKYVCLSILPFPFYIADTFSDYLKRWSDRKLFHN